MTIVIRKANHTDLEQVRQVLITTWHSTYDNLLGTDKVTEITNNWHTVEILKQNLLQPDSIFLVAEQDNELNATAYATYEKNNKIIQLSRIYVLPGNQGKGIGKQLLEKIYKSFPNAEAIELEVEARNQKAASFYLKHGFKVIGTGTDCGVAGSGIEHDIMKKNLSQYFN